MEVDTQEHVEATTVIKEPVVDTEVEQGENKRTSTQEPTYDVVVPQEPAAEVEQSHPREVVTPTFDIKCSGTSGPDEGWSSEKTLLILELQKWKQEALSLQEGVISLDLHQKKLSSL